MCSVTSCGSDDKSNVDTTVEELQGVENETAEIPIEIKNKLQAALDAEPIMKSADEWTVDDAIASVRINGNSIKNPCSLHDLGDGFEITEHSEVKSNNKVSGKFSYYGCQTGSFVVKNCDSEEEIYDAPLTYIAFTDSSAEWSPISVNGVTMGSTSEEAAQGLYFLEFEKAVEEDGAFLYSRDYGTFSIICSGRENVERLNLNFIEK